MKGLGEGIFHLGKGLEAFSNADAERIGNNIEALENLGDITNKPFFSKNKDFIQAIALSSENQKLNESITMKQMSAGLAGGGEGAGTIINNDNRTITIQSAPQLTNITGLEFARPQTGKVGTWC